MHILLIHQAFAAINEPGGTRHHEFARQLARRGHRVTVIASQVSYLTGRAVGDGGWLMREVDDAGVEILRFDRDLTTLGTHQDALDIPRLLQSPKEIEDLQGSSVKVHPGFDM